MAEDRNLMLRLPYALCKKYGIELPKDATPRQAWEALKKRTGKSPGEIVENETKTKENSKNIVAVTAKKKYNNIDSLRHIIESRKMRGKPTANEIRFREVDPDEFVRALKRAYESNPIVDRWRVTVYDAEHYKGCKLYVSDGGSTVAVTPDGDIISLCKNWNGGEHGVGKALLRKAVKEGGVKLDAYGKKLFNIYTSNGFESVSWTEWDSEYAPEDWLKAKAQGETVKEEPVIFYKYTGKSVDIGYEEFMDNVLPSESYEAAQIIRDEEI